MKKIIINNILIFIFLSFLLILFIECLNLILAGVPIYDKLKIDRSQLTHIKSKSKKINNKFIPKFENLKKNTKIIERCGYQESGIYHMVYDPDSNGHRDNHEYLYKNTDVVIIGDSFTFSACVNKPYDLISQLKENSKKKILNLSTSGSGPAKQLKIVKKFTQKTNFDYFIWVFYEGNDYQELIARDKINRDKVEKTNIKNEEKIFQLSIGGSSYLKSRKEIMVDYNVLTNLQKKYPKRVILDNKWQNEKIVKLKIFIAERLRGLSSLLKYFKNYPNIPYNKKYDELLNKMDIYLTQKKIKKKYIYYLPKYTRLAHKNKNHPDVKHLNQIKNFVMTAANKYDFKFIDGADFFHNRKNPLDIFHYKLPTHFNENGYKLEAKHINSFILN